MPKQHANIPIFIPHLGCPNDCVFCNQRTISGHTDFDPKTVKNEIEAALSTLDGRHAEIAFFGGSFTGIDRELMIYLLDTADAYVKAGKITGIRLSTRPDYINEEILDILKKYTVNAVELGIQSTSDRVLSLSKRGHTADVAGKAARAVVDAGFNFVGQMMIGLPGSTPLDEIKTAEDICEFGARAARVYPTVVFRKTELCRMAADGAYLPLDNATAAKRTADVLDVFDRHKVDVIRVGLCASENLSSESEVYGGANHPALGELAMSELFLRRICEKLDAKDTDLSGKNLIIYVPRGAVSKAVGQKKQNIAKLREKYGVNVVKILEKNGIFGYNIVIDIV